NQRTQNVPLFIREFHCSSSASLHDAVEEEVSSICPFTGWLLVSLSSGRALRRRLPHPLQESVRGQEALDPRGLHLRAVGRHEDHGGNAMDAVVAPPALGLRRVVAREVD